MDNSLAASFHRDHHVRYWLRCLKTLLPTTYTSGESQRMLLACFTLSALDLLGALHSNTTVEERASYADWLYHCQHPNGGFRGFAGTITKDFPNANCKDDVKPKNDWDTANIAGTFFALAALGTLRDNMKRVRRRECLRWLKKLQWEDGSFAEVLGEGGRREGGQDSRIAFLALLTRKILRYGESGAEEEEDIDTESLTRFILQTMTYEGGFAQSPLNEAQGGSTYCGIGALSLLGKLPIPSRGSFTPQRELQDKCGINDEVLQDIVRYLVYRQVRSENEEDSTDLPLKRANSQKAQHIHPPILCEKAPSLAFLTTDAIPPISTAAEARASPGESACAGFNGRCNKVADTCYSWWVGGSLGILSKVHLLNINANRSFLLGKTQHIIGGFGKLPEEPPDILHSYLGLAALSLLKEPGFKSIDPVMCISLGAREHLDQVSFAVDGTPANKLTSELYNDIQRKDIKAEEVEDRNNYMDVSGG